ncbi:phosphate ABC transporter permease [Pontimonas salivibrio]|jgi:phosphate transport system permease protein|uniref:Phosphate transport system permease protein PstA n=1 Tax=Pontimonas salivibrio TaxID=1159327 RepID=A0A2L2BNN3_9MICO|nr:phosphate ABC transporter permease PstA [Pontimonas salivibrio]AVG23275.1 phosphate ABC transporter permease [Pontimonas salivibrio]
MSTSTPKASLRSGAAMAGARATVASQFQAKDTWAEVGRALFVGVMIVALSVAIVAIFAILAWAFVEGRTRIDLDLIMNGPSTARRATAGYSVAIVGTLQIIAGVIALIVPLGTGAAIYLEQFADRSKWYNRLIELNIQNLAGVPSIVFGILGLAFFVRGPFSWGLVAAAGSATIALLVLPTVILASREAIRAVPSSILEGSLALGVTRWQAVRKQVLPAAFPGILTGIILAISRAIGEAAPLLLVGALTFVTFYPSFFEGGFSALPVLIYNYAGRAQEEFQILAAAGVLLMLVILLAINSVAIWLRARYERTW